MLLRKWLKFLVRGAGQGIALDERMSKRIHGRVLASTIVLATGCFDPPNVSIPGVDGSETDSAGDESTTEDAADDESSSSDGGDDSSGELADPPGGDTIPPEVVELSPADGADQIYDETITIAFSEPMDQASVAAAFPEAGGLVWDAAGMEVQIAISFPFADVPVLHDVVVPTSVTDLAGNHLAEPVVVSIGLAALERVTLLHDPDLSGFFVESEFSHLPYLLVGDLSSNELILTGVSFSLANLPEAKSVLAIRRASFRSQMLGMDGDVNDPGLGGVVVDHVTFDSPAHLGDPTVWEAAFASLFAAGQAAPGKLVDVDVSGQLAQAWSAGNEHFQLRFHPTSSNDDGLQDLVVLRRTADEEDGDVPEGLPEPDPEHLPRIEIEYFH
jgi:hypothetical protein